MIHFQDNFNGEVPDTRDLKSCAQERVGSGAGKV